MIPTFAFICAVLGAVLYGGADGDGWASIGKGATGGMVVGIAIGVFAWLSGG